MRAYSNIMFIYYIPYIDEEIGGKDGMELFCQSEDFKKLNVGFVLDEGNFNTQWTYNIANSYIVYTI